MKRFLSALAAVLLFCPAACLVPLPAIRAARPLPQDELLEGTTEEMTPAPEAVAPENEIEPEEIEPNLPRVPAPAVEIAPEPEPEPEKEPLPEVALATYVRTLTDGLNVRIGAGTEYASLGTVQRGVLLHLEKKCGGWYETRFRGRCAYVSANETYSAILSMAEGDARIEHVIAAGLDVLGTPYVYGAVRLHDGAGNLIKGFSKDAFDCSSLMQYMYACEGVMLGVTTRVQVKQGYHVQRDEICRGDLLFFTNAARKDKTGIERVGHVAMYLGDNYILHTASDYAKIEPISAARWGYFLEARRFL